MSSIKSTEQLTSFSTRIESLLKGKSKAEFARSVGILPQQFSRYLKGRIPDLKTLLKIAEVTGKSVEWLVTGAEAGKALQFRIAIDLDLQNIVRSWDELSDEARETVLRVVDCFRRGSPDLRRQLVGLIELLERLVKLEEEVKNLRKKEGEGRADVEDPPLST